MIRRGSARILELKNEFQFFLFERFGQIWLLLLDLSTMTGIPVIPSRCDITGIIGIIGITVKTGITVITDTTSKKANFQLIFSEKFQALLTARIMMNGTAII